MQVFIVQKLVNILHIHFAYSESIESHFVLLDKKKMDWAEIFVRAPSGEKSGESPWDT